MENLNIFYSCKEHIEFLIEEWVNRFEEPPDIDWTHKKNSCTWCDQDAVYSIQTIPTEEENRG